MNPSHTQVLKCEVVAEILIKAHAPAPGKENKPVAALTKSQLRHVLAMHWLGLKGATRARSATPSSLSLLFLQVLTPFCTDQDLHL
jgi:hypothetical protein